MTLTKISATLSLLGCLLLPRLAAAEPGFASPPPSQPLVLESSNWDGRASEPTVEPSSTVRVSVGPGLRISAQDPEGGLCVALDVGARAAGVRASAAWLRSSAEQGMSQYTAELWIDFGAGQRLHPIVAAGAGVARLDARDGQGDKTTATIGVGMLRGSLDYVLPISAADARVGIDVMGSVPATPGADSADARPWLLTVAHVGVGF